MPNSTLSKSRLTISRNDDAPPTRYTSACHCIRQRVTAAEDVVILDHSDQLACVFHSKSPSTEIAMEIQSVDIDVIIARQ